MTITIGEVLRNWTKIDSLTVSGGVRSVSGKWINEREECWYNSTVDIYCKPEELQSASQFIVTLISQYQDLTAFTRNVRPIDSEDANYVTPTGSWTKIMERLATGRSYIWSATEGESLSLKFTSTGLWLRVREGPDCGIFDVKLDEGAWEEGADTYSQDLQYEVLPIFSNLDLKEHTFQVKVTNKKNAASSGYKIAVDAFIPELDFGALQAWVLPESVGETRARILGVDTIGTSPYRAILHYELAPWAFDAALNRLLSFIYGSENLKLKQKATTGELQTEILGSEGLPIVTVDDGVLLVYAEAQVYGSEELPLKQKPTTGELQNEEIAPSSMEGGETTEIGTSAKALTASSIPCKAVLIQADYDNSSYILLGGESTQAVKLYAGDCVPVAIDNVNKPRVKGGAASQKATWFYVN